MNRRALPAAAALAMLAGAAPPAHAFKYLCNGMNADGTVDPDPCGQTTYPCNAQNAVRWVPGILQFKVDVNTVPSGVSQSRWSTLLNASLQAWNNVSGSTLSIQNVGPANTRQFGANDANHELFWINSATEWQQKVGAGVNGALGVTLPRYSFCGQPAEMEDADLALNGAGFCWDRNGCNNIQSTLVHEMGHAFGLGHPCTLCDWAVMSAQAGYDPEYPLFDDQEAVRSLYPGTPGGVGYGCNGNGACTGGLCITTSSARYCSQTCGNCPAGFACEDVSPYGMVCVFAAGSAATPVGEGENCSQRPCAANLQCAGDGNNFTCYRTCTPPNGACGANQQCVELQGGGGVCLTTAGNAMLGEVCNAQNLCVDGLLCILETDTSGRCRSSCNPAGGGSGCPAGLACFELQSGGGACLTDTRATEGGVCTTAGCQNGLVCIRDTATQAHCYIDCNQTMQCPNPRFCNVYNGGTANQFAICEDDNLNPTTSSTSSTGGTSGSTTSGGSSGGGTTSSGGASSGGASSGGASSGGTGGRGFGETCNGNGDCQSQRCVADNGQSICVTGCDPRLGHYDCPENAGCVPNNQEDLSQGGVCIPGRVGSGAVGSACQTGAECEFGICADGKCTVWCTDSGGCGSFGGDGYACDDSEVQPGICRPSATGITPPACACAATDNQPQSMLGLWAALGLLGVVTRRRRG